MNYQAEKEFAEDRIVGCRTRARQHRGSAAKWRKRAIAIDVLLAVLSAAAGLSLIAGLGGVGAVVLGILAVAAAGLTTARDSVGPAKKAQDHQEAATTFSALGGSFRALVRTWQGNEESHEAFLELQREHEAAEKRGPDPEEWS